MIQFKIILLTLFVSLLSLVSCSPKDNDSESEAKSMITQNGSDISFTEDEKASFPTFMKFFDWIESQSESGAEPISSLDNANNTIDNGYSAYLEVEIAKLKVLESFNSQAPEKIGDFFKQDTFETFEIIAAIIDQNYEPTSSEFIALNLANANTVDRAAVESHFAGFLSEVSSVDTESLKAEQEAYGAAFTRWYTEQTDEQKEAFHNKILEAISALEQESKEKPEVVSLVKAPIPVIVVGGYTLGVKTYLALCAGFAWLAWNSVQDDIERGKAAIQKQNSRIEYYNCLADPDKDDCTPPE